MSDILWIVAVLVVFAIGFIAMGKLSEYMEKNRADRRDLSRMKHGG